MPVPLSSSTTNCEHMEEEDDAEAKTTKCSCNGSLFDDLATGEFFNPSVLHVDRVLAVDDDHVDITTIEWKTTPLPPNSFTGACEGLDKGKECDEEAQYLCSTEGYLTIKVSCVILL